MAKSKHVTRVGADLLCFLSDIPSHPPIKLIAVSGNMLGHVSQAQAIPMLRSGMYTGKCATSRVLYIRQNDTRSQTPPDPSYWDGRACGLYRWVKDCSYGATPARSAAIWDSWAQREPQREPA